eukprot:7066_1
MTTINKQQMLIYGFIRSIEKVLDNNKIIPVEIIDICYAFHSIPLQFFILTKGQKLHVANIYNQTVSNLVINDKTSDIALNNRMNIFSCCHIPDISRYINTKNDSQNSNYNDGLVGIMSTMYNTEPYHPFVLLFDAARKEPDENMNYHLYMSSKHVSKDYNFSINTPNIIYSNEHGIMYANQGLFQLKWKDIDINSKDFNFEKTNYFELSSGLKTISHSFASVELIHDTQKLFIIEGFTLAEYLSYICTLIAQNKNTNKMVHENKNCYMFDLNT